MPPLSRRKSNKTSHGNFFKKIMAAAAAAGNSKVKQPADWGAQFIRRERELGHQIPIVSSPTVVAPKLIPVKHHGKFNLREYYKANPDAYRRSQEIHEILKKNISGKEKTALINQHRKATLTALTANKHGLGMKSTAPLHVRQKEIDKKTALEAGKRLKEQLSPETMAKMKSLFKRPATHGSKSKKTARRAKR